MIGEAKYREGGWIDITEEEADRLGLKFGSRVLVTRESGEQEIAVYEVDDDGVPALRVTGEMRVFGLTVDDFNAERFPS